MGAALFELRGKLTSQSRTVLGVLGAVFLIALWYALPAFGLVPSAILPYPHKVLGAFPQLHFDDALIRNAFYSIKLNVLGYVEAVALALPLGLVIGLFPFFRGLTERYIAATRFLPLTVLIGVFIAMFGIESNMKVQFLACGIFVYLLPVVIQRVDEVEQVYVDTVKTLGASRWQTIKSVFIPDVVSRVFDDVRVLVAISWTYITMTEVINSSDGGIGALSYIAARQSRMDKVYALLAVIILIAFLQDRLFKMLDKKFFPHKYV